MSPKGKEKSWSRRGETASQPLRTSPSHQQSMSAPSRQRPGISKLPRHVLDASVESPAIGHMEDRISCRLLRWRGPLSLELLVSSLSPPLWHVSLSLSPVLDTWRPFTTSWKNRVIGCGCGFSPFFCYGDSASVHFSAFFCYSSSASVHVCVFLPSTTWLELQPL